MASSFDVELLRLVDLFGSNRRAADFLGLSHSRVAAWINGNLPSAANLERIVDGADVIRELRAQGLSDREVLTEVHARWPELQARPTERVAQGDAAAVLAAIPARYVERSAGDSAEPDGGSLPAALELLAKAATALAHALGDARR